MAIKLKGKEKNYLRGLGHHLKPIVQIGKEGISEKFIENLEAELERHELLKVKMLENAPEGKDGIAAVIEKGTGCSIVQIIGKTLLIYRPSKEEPRIDLKQLGKKEL